LKLKDKLKLKRRPQRQIKRDAKKKRQELLPLLKRTPEVMMISLITVEE